MPADLVQLVHDGMTLQISPAIGGAIVNWTRNGIPLLRPTPAEALAQRNARLLGCFPLVPYSNRIAWGRFRFRGTDYQLDRNLPGHPHAIHGVGWQREWQVVATEASAVRLGLDYDPGRRNACAWPFRLGAELDYVLTGDALSVTISVENRDDHPVPIGLGLHPYFPRTPETCLEFQAQSVWTTSEDGIPDARVPIPPPWRFDRLRSIGHGHGLDNCFAGWSGTARLAWPERNLLVTIGADGPFGHLIVYIPQDRDFLAVEPVSHMPDAVNRIGLVPDQGLQVIDAGQRVSGTVEFAVTDFRG